MIRHGKTRCVSPVLLKAKYERETGHKCTDENLESRKVPCGRCSNCIRRKSLDWIIRLKEEYRDCVTSAFLTLTYADEHLSATEDGLMSLRRKHVTEFTRKLRDQNYHLYQEQIKPRFYFVGEYGGETERPHYHGIIYNLHPSLLKRSTIIMYGRQVIVTPEIQKLWAKGHIHHGDVTGGSITYTTQYLNKKLSDHEEDYYGREREKSNISNGIGEGWLLRNASHYRKYPSLTISIGNTRAPMPRYYADKLYSKDTKRKLKQEMEQRERMQDKRECICGQCDYCESVANAVVQQLDGFIQRKKRHDRKNKRTAI